MALQVDELFWTLNAKIAPLIQAVAIAQTRLGQFTRFIKSPIGALSILGATATLAGIKAANMAAELDKALREVSTLLPKTVQQMGLLRDEVIALSTRVPEPPAQLTRGLYQVVSAGITDTSEALDVLEVSSRAAAAGLSDTFTAVDAITTVLNAFQLEADEASRVSDVFFTTIAEGKIRLEDIAGSIGNVATSAGLAGLSVEEMGAALATLTKFGLSAQESANALNRMLFALINSSHEAREAQKAMGAEFNIAALRSKGFAQFLEDVRTATNGEIDALAEINPSLRSLRALLVLAGDGLGEFERILTNTESSTGATDRAFRKMQGALENQERLLKNRLNAIWLEFGEHTLPIVLGLLERINRLLESDMERQIRLLEELGLAEEAMQLKRQKAIENTRQAIREALEEREQLARDLVTGRGFEALATGAPDIAAALGATPQERINALLGDAARRQEIIAELKERAATADAVQVENLTDAIRFLEQMRLKQAEINDLNQRLFKIVQARIEEEEDEGDESPPGRLDAAIREARAELRTEMEEIRVSLTETEVDDLLREFILLRDRIVEAFGEIPAEFDEVLAMMFDSILAADVSEAFAEQIEIMTKELDKLEDRGARTELPFFRLRERLKDMRAELIQQQRASDKGTDAWARYQKQIDELDDLLRRLNKEMGTARDRLQEQDREIRELIDDIDTLARGFLDAAEAIGTFDAETGRALDSLINLGSAIAEGFAGGFHPQQFAGIIGGVANLAASIFGGDSERERERARRLRENTAALERLRLGLLNARDVLSDIAGRDIIAAIRALEDPSIFPAIFTHGERFTMETLRSRLHQVGLTLGEFEQIAQKLGIESLETTDDLEALLEALKEFREAGVQGFFEGFEGQMQLLDAMLEFSDKADDPVRKLEGLLDIFLDMVGPLAHLEGLFGELLSFAEDKRLREFLMGLDLSTAEGREQLDRFIQGMFEAFRQNELDISQFGDLTAAEFLDLLTQLESTIDQIEEGAETGVTRGFQVSRTITEVTGNRMIGVLTTINFWQRLTAENTGMLLQEISGLKPPFSNDVRRFITRTDPPTSQPPPPGPQVRVDALNVTVNGPVSETEAQDTGRRIGAGIMEEIDRELGRTQVEIQRSFGRSAPTDQILR